MGELVEYPIRESIVERSHQHTAQGEVATVRVGDFLVASFPMLAGSGGWGYRDAEYVREELELAIRRRLASIGIEAGLDAATQPTRQTTT